MEFRTFKLRKDPNCPVCGNNPTITKPIDYEQFCGVPILDPKSIEETKAEVKRAKSGDNYTGASDPGLDERGLPHGYSFDPKWEVTPRDVKRMLDKKEKSVFIDCRLPNEYQITKVDGTTLIPLQQLQQRVGELAGKEDETIVVHCRSGARS